MSIKTDNPNCVEKEKDILIPWFVFSDSRFSSLLMAVSDVLFSNSPAYVVGSEGIEPGAEFRGSSLVHIFRLTGAIDCLLSFPACELPLVQGSLYMVFSSQRCLVCFVPVSALES